MARAPTFWKPGAYTIIYRLGLVSLYQLHTSNIYLLIIIIGTAAPPQQGVGLNLERVSEDSEGAGTCITYNTNLSLSISQQKQRLPIFQVLPTTFAL